MMNTDLISNRRHTRPIMSENILLIKHKCKIYGGEMTRIRNPFRAQETLAERKDFLYN